jgi:phosphoribosylanthranilate isomerase
LTDDAAKAIVAELKGSGLNGYGGNVPKLVGLFAGQPLDEVIRTASECGLDLVQLCGDESLDYCRRVPVPVIKVLHVPDNPGHDPDPNPLAEQVRQYRDAGHLVTLDRQVDGLPGGTGQAFDWSIAAEVSRRGGSFLLAGGLTPDNVGQAIDEVRPWGVDVSSGVETAGAKDPEKIRAFIHNVRQPGN